MAPKQPIKDVWEIKITSKTQLSDVDRDFIVNLINEIIWRESKKGSVVLHDVLESPYQSQLIVEIPYPLIPSFLSSIQDNVTYRVALGSRLL